MPEILIYSRLGEPVFVQTAEPSDAALLRRLSSNFIHVPVTGNWWVDHRVMRPMPGIVKDADISMVAAWASFKRHAQFFHALGRLRSRGVKLKVLLVGFEYRMDGALTRDDVFGQARRFGVSDQIEMYENLKPEEVCRQINRTKVHVLWSRREGSNRAIIEAMFADVPGVLRAGHNFGHHYPYINAQTGRFATEESLPDTLTSMIEHRDQFTPRSWMMDHMTPQTATAILNDHVRRLAVGRGEPWTTDLVVKTTQIHSMTYWNTDDEPQFAADYAYIRSLLREGALTP
jgi:hypothetical protein